MPDVFAGAGHRLCRSCLGGGVRDFSRALFPVPLRRGRAVGAYRGAGSAGEIVLVECRRPLCPLGPQDRALGRVLRLPAGDLATKPLFAAGTPPPVGAAQQPLLDRPAEQPLRTPNQGTVFQHRHHPAGYFGIGSCGLRCTVLA